MDLIERAAQKAQKKEKEARSLVERAADKSGASTGAKAVGGIGSPRPAGEARPDPSSLNPTAPSNQAKPEFRGIGQPGSGPKPKPADGETGGKPAVGGIGTVGGIGSVGGGASKASVSVPMPPFEAKTDTLAIGVPGAIAATEPAMTRSADQQSADKADTGNRKARRTEEIDIVALREAGYITPDMPPNLMSEEFRIIKRSLLLTAFAKGDKKVRNSNIVLVTSSNPGEGKTFCTINLALSIATEQDVTVLLVDADFSKPEVLNRLGVAGGRGLMDVVADGELDLSDCLVRTNIPNLVLLPAGRQHNLTTELLASERMEMMVNELSNRYPDRIVIFDSPPVLASSAASVLALYMGQTVFVIEAEKTTEPQIKESLSMISACENINLILNKTRYSGSNKKFASYYGYGGR